MKNKKKSKPTIYVDSIDAIESSYLYISDSRIKGAGKGLFTAIPIFKDEIISIFKGDIISFKEAKAKAAKGENAYFIDLIDGRTLDSQETDCFAKYANDPAGTIKSPFKSNSDISMYENGSICLVANKNIKAGEEIFCSYGRKYWTIHQNK
ncbi:MAG: SET domain-containing protein-lysine N-methyltransferase [Chitinophagales bacterium]